MFEEALGERVGPLKIFEDEHCRAICGDTKDRLLNHGERGVFGEGTLLVVIDEENSAQLDQPIHRENLRQRILPTTGSLFGQRCEGFTQAYKRSAVLFVVASQNEDAVHLKVSDPLVEEASLADADIAGNPRNTTGIEGLSGPIEQGVELFLAPNH